MTTIIGFITANLPYIMAYPFVGYALAKISNKLYDDGTPNEELGILNRLARVLFFPIRYHEWADRDRKDNAAEHAPNLRSLTETGENYCKLLIFLWPLSAIRLGVGLFEAAFFILTKCVITATELIIKLPVRSYSLLQSGSRRIKMLAPGKNQDIKTVIGQIEKFKSTHLGMGKSKILSEQNAIRDRLLIVRGNIENWEIVVRKNADTSAKINPIIQSLAKEEDALASKNRNLFQLEEKLNAAEKNLSESIEILWRCLSTIPLGIPVYTDGPQLIKGDYVATLAAETISQAETEMARIKEEISRFNEGGEHV